MIRVLVLYFQPDPNVVEAQLDNGLIRGHAYSVTKVKSIDINTPRMSGKIPMLRIRNPWGNEAEWKGAWSDKSVPPDMHFSSLAADRGHSVGAVDFESTLFSLSGTVEWMRIVCKLSHSSIQGITVARFSCVLHPSSY